MIFKSTDEKVEFSYNESQNMYVCMKEFLSDYAWDDKVTHK